jgi:hypothetical protein
MKDVPRAMHGSGKATRIPQVTILNGDPTTANNSLPETGLDCSKSSDTSDDKDEMGRSGSGNQRNENLNYNEKIHIQG